MRFQLKVILVTLVILVITLALNSVLSLASFEKIYVASLTSTYELAGKNLKRKIEQSLRFGKPLEKFQGMDRLLDAVKENKEISYVGVGTTEGRILYHSDKDMIGKKFPHPVPEMTNPERAYTKLIKGMYVTYIPIQDRSKETVGVVNIAFSRKVVYQKLKDMASATLRVLWTLMLLTSVGLIFLMTTLITRPVKREILEIGSQIQWRESAYPRRQGVRKLLVVDDQQVLPHFTELNQRMGGQLSVSISGDHAGAVKRAKILSPDLILMNILLPGVSAIDLTKHLKDDQTTCKIPVVLITAPGTEDKAEENKSLFGADYVITAPISVEKLVELVEQVNATAEAIERSLKLTLEVVEGPEAGQVFEFDEPESILVGRTSEARLQFARDADSHISEFHFVLEIHPPKCIITDLGSTTGTCVNEQQITRSELKDGDEIQVGSTRINVSIDVDTERKVPVLAAEAHAGDLTDAAEEAHVGDRKEFSRAPEEAAPGTSQPLFPDDAHVGSMGYQPEYLEVKRIKNEVHRLRWCVFEFLAHSRTVMQQADHIEHERDEVLVAHADLEDSTDKIQGILDDPATALAPDERRKLEILVEENHRLLAALQDALDASLAVQPDADPNPVGDIDS